MLAGAIRLCGLEKMTLLGGTAGAVLEIGLLVYHGLS